MTEDNRYYIEDYEGNYGNHAAFRTACEVARILSIHHNTVLWVRLYDETNGTRKSMTSIKAIFAAGRQFDPVGNDGPKFYWKEQVRFVNPYTDLFGTYQVGDVVTIGEAIGQVAGIYKYRIHKSGIDSKDYGYAYENDLELVQNGSDNV